MATLEMMSLFKLHVQQVGCTAQRILLFAVSPCFAEPEGCGEAIRRDSRGDQPVM
jgi:hypothetical protein